MSDDRSRRPKGGVIPGGGALDADAGSTALKKIPLTLTVRKEFDYFSDFIGEFGRHVYPEGIFIPADKPKPKGAAVRIDFRMRDGFQILLAVGEVVRADAGVPGAANGMWVSFRVLDKEQAALIRRIVEQRDALATLSSGGNTPSRPLTVTSRVETEPATLEPGDSVVLLEADAMVEPDNPGDPIELPETAIVSEGPDADDPSSPRRRGGR
ncbi:MAG TPA: PilZ domain-containing protein [bacterium]|nr:PilZ domain-containing protein [bacterium]